MRIAVLAPDFPIRDEPFRGQPIYQTCKALATMAEVRAFCPQARYPDVAGLRPRTFVYHKPDYSYSPPGVPTTYFEYPALPVVSRPFTGALCARILEPHLRQWRPDVLIAYWLFPEGWAAVLAGRKLGIPVIVGARGSDLKADLSRMNRVLTARVLRNADGGLMVSNELRRRAVAYGMPDDKIRTVLNGCDTGVFHRQDQSAVRQRLGLDPEAKVVLFVGHLQRSKGVLELLNSVDAVAERHPKLQVALVGNGVMQSEVRAMAAKGSRVRLLGTLASPQIAEWLAAADLLTLPSYSEGCPNVVIEALACGTPVVATTVGAIPDLVSVTTGVLVPPQDPQALIRALCEALAGRWDRDAIARGSSRSWMDVAKDTMDQVALTIGRKAELRGPLSVGMGV